MRIPKTATAALTAVTVLATLLIGLVGENDRATIVMGVIPSRLSGLIAIPGAVPAWLTPITATLVHGGILHLAFNMLMLVWCGTMVERVLGRSSLIILYVVGAYVSAVAQWLTDMTSPIPMIGASGAISAIIGAFSLMFGQQKRLVKSLALNRALNALWLLAAWVVLQMMTGFLAGQQGFMLATPAHIGGFLAGLLLQRPLLLWRYRKA
jgi:membrane associated rhomboid family serine protease